MMEDPDVVNPRVPWKVRFGVGAVLAGCVVTGTVFMGLLMLLFFGAQAELEAAGVEGEPQRLAFQIGGLAALAILVVGPTVAFGIGWLLRGVANQSLHVIAFAVAGAVVGAVGGAYLGGPAMANLVAGMLGVAAALGRLVVSPLAKV